MSTTTTAGTSGKTAPLIGISEVCTAFGGETVLNRVSFDVQPGEFVCLLGPSGCGKSTTLRLIGGLLGPDAGDIEVAGRTPAHAWTELAYVFQQPRLVPWRTVLANVMLGMELRGSPHSRSERQERALAQLDLVGLAGHARKYPDTLSGGERQRVAIARALALDPQVILMDEPLSALDVATKKRLREQIQNVWSRTGKTIVFVTHDIGEALFLADRIVLLSGKPTAVLREVVVPGARPRDVDHEAELIALQAELAALFEPSAADSEEDSP